MKKILILMNSMNGLYSFRRELVEELINNDMEVYISGPTNKRKHYFRDLGCEIVETEVKRRSKNIFSDLKLLSKYFKLIGEIQPDIILTYTIKPNIYGGIAARFSNVNYIANITGLGTGLENKSIIQKMLIFLYKFAFGRVDSVFFQNMENRNFFNENNINCGNQILVPGSGVNLKYFMKLEYPCNDVIVFTFISRIIEEKGVDYFIEAAKFIKDKYPNVMFHMCGSCGENYRKVIKSLEQKNIIVYHGHIDDVRRILKKTHCIIHPTYYPEGMSNVLLESAASCRPIITTNRSGCREIIDNGINGYVIKQKDTNDLINKIEKFLSLKSDEKMKMGLNGRQKVQKEFDRQIVVKAYLKEIKRLIS